MRILSISCLLWTILFIHQVKGESKCLRTNRQPDRMCVTKCDPLTGCRAEEKCLCDGDCGYSCVKRDLSCGRPPRVSNARPQYPATNFSSVVTYVCNEGHTLSGAAKRTCRANGRWDGVGPNCLKMCSLPTIPFSTYIAKPVNYTRKYRTGERITLACKKGFKKKPGGNPVRICISGLWTRFPFQCEGTHACKRTIRAPRTKCTLECSPQSGCDSDKYKCLCDGSCGFSCVEIGMSCGNPPSISNGNLVYNNTSYNSTAHYSCNEGYNLNTAPVKRCTAKKRWEGLTPRCLKDCKPPTIPRNANISNPSKKYHSGYKVTFKCNEGYNQEGMATQMCFLGSWTVLPFKCTEGGCGDPGTPENGRKLGVTYSVNSKVYFDCDLGYELEGSADRKCQLNGTWTGIQPDCKVVNCGFPPRPKNGTFIGNETTFRSELEFRCDEGFELQGSARRMCTTDKSWTGKDVTCNAVDCGSLDPPKNGSLIVKETTYPNHAEIRCDEGFTLLGSRRRTCQANGTWSGNITECKAVDCGALSVPTNGSSIGIETTFPNKIRFRCDTGFDLVGSSVRMCMPDKSWNGVKTVCKAVDCGKLPHPTNGSVIGKETTFPNEVEISCDKGFILRGSHRRKCKADRNWSGDTTVCEAIDCGPLPVPQNGSLLGKMTVYPSILQFSCDEGFTLHGSSYRKCQTNGAWSGNSSFCKAKDCGVLAIPMNGSLEGSLTTFPNKISFGCDEGFILRGSKVRRCLSNGKWCGNKTFCEAKDCGELVTPTNGSSFGNLTTYPHEKIFSCDEGFILRGSRTRQCLPSGNWSGNTTICVAVDCGVLSSPLNGSSSGNRTVYPNSVRLWCDSGFVLHGSWLRTCQSNGKWDGNETICEAIDCGELMTPQNGTMLGKVTTYPNILRFNCDEGFILTGSSVRKCGSNGTWSGNETKCQAKDCGPLAVPVNGSSIGDLTVFPHKVVFNCDEGFLLSGSHIRVCQANGTWSGNQTFCQAVDCGPLSVPANGSSLGAATVFPNSQHFICDPGFILNGSALRTCQPNGTWSGFTTTCSAVDCGRPQPLRNGSVIGENTVYPNFVIHNCDEGFILRGPAEIKCQTNGTWSQTDSFCEAKDCGNLSKPINGSMTGLETTFPNKVSFNCDEGFILSGSSVRYCQSNGSWSGTETTCTAVDCGSLPAPMNGSSHGVATVFPNGIQFSCEPGFILSGSAERTCQPNGTWSGVTTVCTAIDCGPLAVPTNGSSIGFLTTFPNKIDFSCDEGFFLRGSQTRHCEENGTWSGNQTFCQAVDCGSLSVPVNGSSSGDSTLFPNSVLFNCDTGFILSGSTVRTCQPNATWSGSPTTCSAIDCGSLSVPMNGSSSGNSTVFPNSVHFQCDPGFLLNGSAIRTCQANGTWGGLESLCIAVDCGNPQPLQNGSIVGNKTVYPNSVTHRCDEGFILHGSSRITCQTNGTWGKTSSYCEARNCGVLDIPVNGSTTGSKTTYPSKLYFSCDDGFILRGSTIRQCLADGTWSGNDTSCEAVDCGPLLVPVNGSSSGNFTVFPNSVIFKCDPGFNLYGSPTRMCQANGTWSGKAVSCAAKDCGPLAAPTNGSSTGELTFFPNEIAFHCDKGFLLKGSSIRHCQTNGNWSGNQTFCKAVDCGLLSNPMNGSSSGDSTVFPNSVLFDCDSGFILSGSHERKCLANGSWSGFSTVCSAVDCGPLSAPKNGSSTGNLTVFPNSVAFNCDPGFLLNGSATRKCQANGTWSGLQAVCNAIDCGMPQPLQNGTVIGEFTVYPNFVTHICDEGFVLRGPPKIKCQTNGTWSKSSTFCEAKDCGAPVVPVNGSATGQKTTFPNEVTFSCDEGFILNGSTVRRCQANGSWSGVQTSCRAVDCGPLSAPKNGSFVGDSTVFPNSLLFACNLGFILDGSYRRTCQANGTWDGLETVCIAKDCGALEIPANGSLHGDLTTFPNKVDFSCDQGFLLSGSQTRRCQGNGTWSGIQTYCEAVDCGPLYVPMNGSASGNSTVFPNSVQFSCDPGFILNGSAVRTCQPHGTWNGTKTVCVAVDCGPLPVPTNGSSSGDSTVFPNAVQFSCDPGFILSGSASRMCQTNGTWSGFSTECSAIDCGWPEPLQNGSIIGKFTVYPNSVRHICDKGFVLRGSPEIKCQANGTWSKTSSFCEAKDCGALEVPLNGSITGRETTFPNEAILSCDVGFILHGSSFRRCQANGTWSGTKTVCKAVDCGSLSAPRNGSSLGNFTVFPNELLFYCDPGFLLGGSSTRTCQANGTWSGIETICTPVDCGPLRPLQYGSYNGTSTVFPNVVNAVCDMGFILRGSSRIKCQVNGTWSSNDTFCDAKDCGNLPRPLNGSVIGDKTTYPSEVEFECDAGFNLQGSTIRRCEADGQWSGVEVKCRAVDCGRLAIPEHGFAHGNSTTYPNTVTFSCNTGFSLHGTSSRTCQADGTWTSGKTRCQGEDCGKLLPPENGWMFGSDTSHPSKVLFSCASGYSTVGSSQRTCLRNGSWSGQQPRCLPRWCSQAPDVPAFAYQTWTAKNKRYEEGERIYYSCKAGLMMVGIPMRKCVKGRWTKANFRCSAPSCDAPPVPKFAYLTWARGARSKYLNGETAYYSCQAGYELIGIPYIECKDSGWTKIDFSCKAVDCGFLESPPNGGIAKKTGKTFGAIYVFECDEDKGYLMDGSKERRCQADATWSGVQPLCKLQSCVTPSKPMHGKFKSEPRSKYYFENIVGYQCDSGYSLRGHERTKCLIHGNWSHAAPTCTGCSKPLGLKSRMIFSRQLSASSERDSRHSAQHGRLDGNSAWCSARSSFAKYFQIDFGRAVEVTSVATQGHPSEEKWIQRYILRYSLGKNWFTYQESGRDKVFKGNRDGRSAVRHYLKERLVAKKLRIVRHENSRDFMGSTVCLRAEVYGCSFDTECLTFGSEVFAHWNSIKKHTRYIHGYVTKVHRTSVHISPSGKHGGNADSIFELPRKKEFYVIKDEKSSPQEIKIGSDVIVASKDNVGFSQGKVTQKYYSWYGVELGNGKTVWGKVDEIRLLKRPIYCEKEYITA